MKYSKRRAKLLARQKAWEAMASKDQSATTKPGSLNK